MNSRGIGWAWTHTNPSPTNQQLPFNPASTLGSQNNDFNHRVPPLQPHFPQLSHNSLPAQSAFEGGHLESGCTAPLRTFPSTNHIPSSLPQQVGESICSTTQRLQLLQTPFESSYKSEPETLLDMGDGSKSNARWFKDEPFQFPGQRTDKNSSALGPNASQGFVWSSENAQKLLRNKRIVVLGDSVQRCVYKDLVKILQTDALQTDDEIKKKLETHFINAQECLTRMENVGNNRSCIEEREFMTEWYHIRYFYITRVYDRRMKEILKELDEEKPDIVILNSMLWDLSRYGDPEGAEKQFLVNVRALLHHLTSILPSTAMFIWNSTLPISSDIAAGFLHNDMKFLNATLRQTIVEVNYQVSQLVGRYGLDYLDLHFFLRAFIDENRAKDGTHWDAVGHRHITDLILTHIAKASSPKLLQEMVDGMSFVMKDQEVAMHLQRFPVLPSFAEDPIQDLNKIANRFMLTNLPSDQRY